MPSPTLWLSSVEYPTMQLLVTAVLILCALGMVSVILFAIFVQSMTAEKTRLVAQLLQASRLLGRVAPLLEQIPEHLSKIDVALNVTLTNYLAELKSTRTETVAELLRRMEETETAVKETVRLCRSLR